MSRYGAGREGRDEKNWTTEKEIEYLESVGTYRMGARQDPASVDPSYRLGLLEKYLESVLRRADWGNIEPEKVLAKLEALMNDLKAQGAMSLRS